MISKEFWKSYQYQMKNSQNLSESVSEQPRGNPEDFQRSLSNKKDKI
jgi:hypothetical protein